MTANWQFAEAPAQSSPETRLVVAMIAYALQDASTVSRGYVIGTRDGSSQRRQTPENVFKDMEGLAQFVESDILWHWVKAIGLDPLKVGSTILQIMHGHKELNRCEVATTTRGGPAGRGDYAES